MKRVHYGNVATDPVGAVSSEQHQQVMRRHNVKTATEPGIGEAVHRKLLQELYPKAKPRSEGPGVVLPPDAPAKRSERRKLIKALARQAKGGESAS